MWPPPPPGGNGKPPAPPPPYPPRPAGPAASVSPTTPPPSPAVSIPPPPPAAPTFGKPQPAPAGQVRCQICETAQAPATECVNCGMRLNLPRGMQLVGDPPIEAVPDLEYNAFDAALVDEETMPDLEPTVSERVGEVRSDFVPGFEGNQDLEVLDFPGDELSDAVPDFEPTSGAFEKTPGLQAGLPAKCPYCGHMQPEGRICENCGMSRTRVLLNKPPVLESDERLYDSSDKVRCRSCGAIVPHVRLCSDCGMPLPELL